LRPETIRLVGLVSKNVIFASQEGTFSIDYRGALVGFWVIGESGSVSTVVQSLNVQNPYLASNQLPIGQVPMLASSMPGTPIMGVPPPA
uniref:Uncharacterized protein n=1 Tax=Romanomermis culicivorax TaxID=13658 RepID=A0A915JWW2_ROMCU